MRTWTAAALLCSLCACDGRVLGPPGAGDEPPFELATKDVQVWPLRVRIGKLAALLGVESSAPEFARIRELASSLGAHDFGAGVSEDLTWNAEKLRFWVKALRPVCESEIMLARFPNLASDPAPFLREALQREVEQRDVDNVADELATLPQGDRYRVACLSILSSVEFVAR